MKCPKCGYLGFETTDRCRNCQYDFSLAPSSTEPELTLHGDNRAVESPTDLELAPAKRQYDMPATALDLDRLFGEPEPPSSPPSRKLETPSAELLGYLAEAPAVGAATPASAPAATMAIESEGTAPGIAAADEALPFDDGPIVAPPAARPPLGVRRSTPELPRNRPRLARPQRAEALDFEPSSLDLSAAASQAASDTVASLMQLPSLLARMGAGAIDVLLLAGIDVTVVYLTLRVTGLQNTPEDLRILPPVPFVGFLALLAFGYLAAFTVAGGQTIGKMMLSLRVIGDDGRPVDAAGGMIRALACMLVPVTLGLSYLPALFTSDHRALHDRLAGTRVVQE
jgi:uncharacterized RDD family membrane protein YckC